MSHDQISGIHDLSIQLSHKLSSFAQPGCCFLPFSVMFLSWSFLPFPWSVGGMFLCCKMVARLMSFVQSALTSICPSIALSKGYEMQRKISKLFIEVLKQQKHSEKHCGGERKKKKQLPFGVQPVFKRPDDGTLQHLFYFFIYLARRIVKLANNSSSNLPLSSLLTYQQLLCE